MLLTHMQTNLQICLRSNFVNLQCVRWRRKPRWLPVAKSRMFYVPPRTVTPENEKAELKRLYNNYNTKMKAIRSYLHAEHNVKSIIVDTEEQEKKFLEEFEECCKINFVWNKKVQEIREKRHLNELESAREDALEDIDKRVEMQRELSAQVEEIVRKEKEAAASFITRDNIDIAVEYALANPVNYNFAIDLDGNIYSNNNKEGKKEA